MRWIKYVVFSSLVGSALGLNAQSLPVGSKALEDHYRREQLNGNIDSSVSFTVRPLIPYSAFNIKDGAYPDSTEIRHNLLEADNEWTQGKFRAKLLPFTFQTQFNTHHPYGWNDGAMIPAKGLQMLISSGIYAEYGPLSIQFQPEIVVAGNPAFETLNKDHYDIIFARYYDFYNKIDLPARFGSKEYSRAYWGQSSIRLNYRGMSFGVSTENLWWGPGMRNALLMSNTAPGFKHLTLNTTKPIKTPIGSFEGQLIAGRLEGSGFGPLEPNKIYMGSNLYVPKPNDWRYLSGVVLTWQPKWVPGLFLGLTKSSQTYSKDLNGFSDYLPFFSSNKTVTSDEPINKRDQRGSLFLRWLWPEEKAEMYFEYGHNNYSGDFLLEPATARAYIFGVRKLLPFNQARNENILLGIEVTQMGDPSLKNVLKASGWYNSVGVPHGYTNRGEVLGAGIGPGGNMQSIEVSWISGLKRLGLQLERYVHNTDFYYYAYIDSKDFRRNWTDFSLAANGEWNYKNFIFNAKLQAIQSLNYQWYLIQQPGEKYMVPGKDVFNLQLQAGLTYRF